MIFSAVVSAEQVTYEITATVNNFDDYNNKLGGAVSVGQQITGTYTFESTIPDGDTSPEYAFYDQTFSGAGGFDLLLSGLSFKSAPTQPGFMHSIFIGNSYSDNFSIGSWGNVPLPNGTPVWDIFMDFYDGTGTALNSTTLSSTPPDVSLFEFHDINISGDAFWISAKVDSIKVSGGNTNPDLVTYFMDATITWVDDIGGALQGALTTGQNLSGNYTFNITTPDEDPSVEFGRYTHQAGSGEFGFDFSAGGLNFKNNPNQAPMQVEPYNSSYNDNYMAYSYGFNMPLPSGAVVTDISFYMYDDSANLINSDQLSTSEPVIGNTGWYEIVISGRHANGYDYFYINAAITNISVLNPPDPNLMIASPPSGLYDRMQMFDMALIFAANLAPVDPVSFGVILNGYFQPLYGCTPGAPNPQNRQTFICPGLSFQLGSGKNTLNFKALLMDGTPLQQSVDWEIIGY